LYQAIPGLGPSGWIPPDTCGAVGSSFVDQSGVPQPGYFLETINMTIAYYRKDTGARTFSQSLGTFFSPLGGVNLAGDPVVVFDDLTGQYVVGVIDLGGSHRARFDLAISYSSDLSQGWYMNRYDVYDGIGSSALNDYPKMGFNADAYVISFNMFPNVGSFHVSTLSVDKSSLAGYTNIVPGGSSNSTLVPAVMHDANPGDPEWLVETGSSTTVRLVKMSNVLSSAPTYQTFSVSVPSYGNPPNATQLGGGSIPVSGLGTRFYNAAERYGQLVATHTIGSGGVAHARWYQFDISSQPTPVLVQSADINPGAGVHTYFPTIEINVNGDLGITYIESSPSEYMSMYVAGQSAGDPLGTMQDGVASHPGTSNYSLSRVGDYSAISVDPDDGVTFWAANEYKGSSSFNTGIAEFGVSPPSTTPSSGFATRSAALLNRAAFLVDDSSRSSLSATVPVDEPLPFLDWLLLSTRTKDRETLFAGLAPYLLTEGALLKSFSQLAPVWDETVSL
jgi:hypothetical protein